MLKNILIVIVFLMLNNITFAQNFANSYGATSDGTFEQKDCDSNACNDLAMDPSCANWDYVDNGQGNLIYRKPVVLYTDTGCHVIDPSQLNLISEHYCVMNYIVRGNGIQDIIEILKGNVVNLIDGSTYTVKFWQRNVGGDSSSSGGKFKITFDGQEAFSDMMTDYNETLFNEQSFDFVASGTSAVIAFSPVISDVGDSKPIQLAIDNISIELKTEGGVSQPCADCTSFELLKNEKYIISGWVKQQKESFTDLQTFTYSGSNIQVSFEDLNGNLLPGSVTECIHTGELIDGWLKVYGEFTVPTNADKINIALQNTSENLAFFDDIRVHPLNGNLKSFVYDQDTQRLMAELDENNFATFYEYDKEGGLVRVKKETEKGVFTIQETRSSNIKKNP